MWSRTLSCTSAVEYFFKLHFVIAGRPIWELKSFPKRLQVKFICQLFILCWSNKWISNCIGCVRKRRQIWTRTKTLPWAKTARPRAQGTLYSSLGQTSTRRCASCVGSSPPWQACCPVRWHFEASPALARPEFTFWERHHAPLGSRPFWPQTCQPPEMQSQIEGEPKFSTWQWNFNPIQFMSSVLHWQPILEANFQSLTSGGRMSREEQLLWERKRLATWGLTSYELHVESGRIVFPVASRLYQCTDVAQNVWISL